PEAVVRIKTILEDIEVIKSMKDDNLGREERFSLVKKKYEALVASQNPHTERLDELGKIITQKMDLLEGRMSVMDNIVL
ncbi:hypothetical protein KI387_040555, partial [Taxus chinensis]